MYVVYLIDILERKEKYKSRYLVSPIPHENTEMFYPISFRNFSTSSLKQRNH